MLGLSRNQPCFVADVWEKLVCVFTVTASMLCLRRMALREDIHRTFSLEYGRVWFLLLENNIWCDPGTVIVRSDLRPYIDRPLVLLRTGLT